MRKLHGSRYDRPSTHRRRNPFRCRAGSLPGRALRLESLENRNLLTTFTVLHTNDSGPDSLRQAIANVNADTASTSDVIAFNIGGGGVPTIRPLSSLVL